MTVEVVIEELCIASEKLTTIDVVIPAPVELLRGDNKLAVGGVLSAQETPKFVTLALIAPEPLVTVQVKPAGCVLIVIAYLAPESKAEGKIKLPFWTKAKSSLKLFCSVTVPTKPVNDPPKVNVLSAEVVKIQLTASKALPELSVTAFDNEAV